jgi:hypothetical protein
MLQCKSVKKFMTQNRQWGLCFSQKEEPGNGEQIFGDGGDYRRGGQAANPPGPLLLFSLGPQLIPTTKPGLDTISDPKAPQLVTRTPFRTVLMQPFCTINCSCLQWDDIIILRSGQLYCNTSWKICSLTSTSCLRACQQRIDDGLMMSSGCYCTSLL